MSAPIDRWAEADADAARAQITSIVWLSGAPPREVRRATLQTQYQRDAAAERCEAAQ